MVLKCCATSFENKTVGLAKLGERKRRITANTWPILANMAGFSMRIVDADIYLAKPIHDIDICFSKFRQADTYRVPIVRIFGATPAGQKTCLHVHQLFPYLYVPIAKKEASEKFAKQFAMSLDYAIQIASGKSVSNMQHHVYDVKVVKGAT